jgi:myo-inositol-1(or 4)-monophosphatase
MIRSPLVTVMTDAAMKAAKGLRRDLGEVENLQVSMKGPGDFVSAADKRAENVIREVLTKARPTYGLVMEESGVVEGTDGAHRWHIDPLDGTKNFLHGFPHFAVSIGLERDGQFVAGVVYDVAKDEMFVAEKGKGAFVNNRRMRVAGRREFSHALIGCGIPHPGRPGGAQFIKELGVVMTRAAGLRRTGSAALDMAWVAAGRMDAYWERHLSSWDIAAGLVLMREAGGTVSDIDGREIGESFEYVVCGNEHMHRELLGHLKSARE